MTSHKRSRLENSTHVAELEGQVREGEERRERLQQEKDREVATLQEEIKKLSKELSDNKVGGIHNHTMLCNVTRMCIYM